MPPEEALYILFETVCIIFSERNKIEVFISQTFIGSRGPLLLSGRGEMYTSRTDTIASMISQPAR